MDPRSNPMQPGLALMATLTSGLLGQSDTWPRQPSSAVRALGHGSHLTPVGPRPPGLLLPGLATQSPSLHPSVPPTHPVLQPWSIRITEPPARRTRHPSSLTPAHSDPRPPVP